MIISISLYPDIIVTLGIVLQAVAVVQWWYKLLPVLASATTDLDWSRWSNAGKSVNGRVSYQQWHWSNSYSSPKTCWSQEEPFII